jgi:membrane-bound metal-dependent hydrolase YbcI (DUF457 family)
MPSPIGHALAGLAIGFVVEPRPTPAATSPGTSRSQYALVGAIVAALPDADLLYAAWHRGVSHSIGATLILMIIAAAVTGWVTGRVRWRWVLLVGAAHASHIVLDWLGADHYSPPGIEALWPFSHRFYVSGVDLFPSTERRLWLPTALISDLRAGITEIAIMGPVAALAWLVTRKRRSRGPTSARAVRPRPSA